MSKKDQKILELEEELETALYEIEFLESRIKTLVERNIHTDPPVKPQNAGSVSFDFWPIREWVRFSFRPWNPGKYLQVCVGPLRLDFFQD